MGLEAAEGSDKLPGSIERKIRHHLVTRVLKGHPNQTNGLEVPRLEIVDGKSNSLRQAVIADLVNSGSLTSEDLAIYQTVGRLFSRNYRRIREKVGRASIKRKLGYISGWHDYCEDQVLLHGDNALVNIFIPEDSMDFCIRTVNALADAFGNQAYEATLEPHISESDSSVMVVDPGDDFWDEYSEAAEYDPWVFVPTISELALIPESEYKREAWQRKRLIQEAQRRSTLILTETDFLIQRQ